jgi:hypothetical protein
MVTVREPLLHLTPITELRPTQITVGMLEVQAKRERLRQQGGKKKTEFLEKHMIPVIRGPKEHYFVVDHHHLSLALHKEGVNSVKVTVIADLRTLGEDEFWVFLDNRSWVHPYDARGRRCGYDEIPRRITGLKDDVFRSLAGELRRRGGFAKDTTPFSEFLWADFLRRRIDRPTDEKGFEKAMKQAMKLAKSPEAHYLPGWCGPHEDP